MSINVSCHPSYHVWGFQSPDELAGLLVVCVCGEGDVVHGHLQLQLLPGHGCDLLRFRHDVLLETVHKYNIIPRNWTHLFKFEAKMLLLSSSILLWSDLRQGSLHTVSSDDDSVPLIRTPALEELSGESALHHTWRRHDDTGANVIKVVHALDRTDQRLRGFI